MRIASDPARRIHLDGTGPVERPLEVTPELTGWAAPTMRAYRYRAGQAIDGESADDEMVMLLVAGDLELEAGGLRRRCTRADPFADDPVVLYLPPGETYRTAIHADADVLYCRAPATGRLPARIAAPGGGAVLGEGEAERLRIAEHRLAPGARARLPLAGRALAYHHFGAPAGHAVGACGRIGPGDAVAAEGAAYELEVGPEAPALVVLVRAAGAA
jgi:hypothetical protein